MLIKAILKNLKNIQSSTILVIKDGKIIDFIVKDLNSKQSPFDYCVIGSDNCYNPKQLFNNGWLDETMFIIDTDLLPQIPSNEKWIFVEYAEQNKSVLNVTIFDDFNEMKTFSAKQSVYYKEKFPNYNSTYYKTS